MGTTLVQFRDTVARDTAISNSLYFVGDSIIRVIRQDHGLNYRNCTFTHDVWLMMMKHPQEAWLVDKVRESVSEFGSFIVWNRDASNKARILVKICVPDILDIPISLVLIDNTNDEGHGHSWTIVNYILHADLIGGMGGDEDPLPPDGGNPHALPNLPFGGILEDMVPEENVAAPDVNAAPAQHNVPHDVNDVPMIPTPPLSPTAQDFMAENLQPAVDAIDDFTAL
ncbi:hypothetical protein ACQ4PT_052850 [Festuca glaucescens]